MEEVHRSNSGEVRRVACCYCDFVFDVKSACRMNFVIVVSASFPLFSSSLAPFWAAFLFSSPARHSLAWRRVVLRNDSISHPMSLINHHERAKPQREKNFPMKNIDIENGRALYIIVLFKYFYLIVFSHSFSTGKSTKSKVWNIERGQIYQG